MSKRIRALSLTIDGNPIFYRDGSDDPVMISDILVRELYNVAADDVSDPRVIVDVGAFAGYSTLFFLHKYPSAHVIAIEPEADSFEVCIRNLEPYLAR